MADGFAPSEAVASALPNYRAEAAFGRSPRSAAAMEDRRARVERRGKMLAGYPRKTLVAAALAAALAISPAAAVQARAGGPPQPGSWLRQALGWLPGPWGWVAAVLGDSSHPAPPQVDPGSSLRTATAPPADGTDQGHSLDPDGQPH